MWELDHQEAWTLRNRYFWTVVLEKTLESPLDCKIKSVNPKGNQPRIFIGRTDAESEAPILWPPDLRSRPSEKTLMLGKTGGKRRRVWQRMRLFDSITNSVNMNLSKLRETLKDRSLECCGPWPHKVRHDLATARQQNVNSCAGL